MSETTLTNASNAIVPADSSVPNASSERLDELGRTLLDFKITADKRVEALEQKLRQSQRQIGFLRTGWLVTLLGIGGGFLFFGFWLRIEQMRLFEQVSAIAVHTGPDSEVVQRLDALEPQVPEGLPERLEVAEATLSQVEDDVTVLNQAQSQRREVITVLTTALQSVIADESVVEPNANEVDESSAEDDTDAAEADASDENADAEDSDS